MTVTGTSLEGVTTIDFGGTTATIKTDTATEITVESPAHAAGQVDVTVTTPGGTSATSEADHYTYEAPPPNPGSPTVTPSSTGSGTPTGPSQPAPILAQRQTTSLSSGMVTIRAKDTSTFLPLSGLTSIPDGREIEATNGRVLITVATPTGKTVSAEVYGGRFRVHQTSSGETQFILTLPLTGCPRVALPRGAAARLAKHSSGPKSRRPVGL